MIPSFVLPPHSVLPRRLALARGGAWLLGAGAASRNACAAAAAGIPHRTRWASAHDEPPLRFAVPPLGSGVATRRHWGLLLGDLERAIGRPVATLSMTRTESLAQEVAQGRVDIAFLCGGLALEAVSGGGMRVLAQARRPARGPVSANRAVLLAREAVPLTLDSVLAQPQRWRIARGDPRSMAGYMLPQLRVFLPRGRDIETHFRVESVGSHMENALAVANGDADLATGTLADFKRFRHQFPGSARQLRILWQSEPVPPAQFLVRTDWSQALQRRVQAVFLGYGQSEEPRRAVERVTLDSMQAPHGFAPARNAALLPVAQLMRDVARQRALGGQWVSEDARSKRLARIDAEYTRQQTLLTRDAGLPAGASASGVLPSRTGA